MKTFLVILILASSIAGAGCGKPKECLIKGNINVKGQKIYHMPISEDGEDYDAFYDKTVIDESKGEKWFCTKEEAEKAGWRPARYLNSN